MTKKTDGWMPLYVADYLADTTRLTTEQHGAYLLILMDYWRNGPPPDDDETLASIAKLSLSDWRKMASKIRGFFTVVDGHLHQKRADDERQKASGIGSKRSEAGKAGAAAKWSKKGGSDGGNGMANAMANGMAGDLANGSQTGQQPSCQIDAHSHSPSALRAPRALAHEGADDPPEPAEATPAAKVSMALRRGGFPTASSSDPRVIAIADAGLTADEVEAAARDAIAEDKGLAWALKAAEGRRRDAAKVRPLPSAQANGADLNALFRRGRS